VALLATLGICALAAAIGGFWWDTRRIYGDAFAGHGGHHTRFGPDARSGKPPKDQAHP
jgi:hypothetical protein